jgi:O-antigen/teichoic acid export membrane protein
MPELISGSGSGDLFDDSSLIMANESGSYRRILKSTSIIGGASFSNIAIGLVRSKVVAILLGPAGMGIVSLYNSLINTATSLSTLGLGTVGTRQIAEAASTDDVQMLRVARRALLWGTLFLAFAGGIVVWSLRNVIAVHVFGSADYAKSIGWLAVGVALSVAGASQGAVIQGMRRIGDIARLSIISSTLSTVLGIAILWQWGRSGLLAYVLIVPLLGFIVGHVYVSRLPKLPPHPIGLSELRREWATLLRLGLAMTGASLMQSVAQLWIRSDIARSLGTESLGQYQAAWSISMQYVNFVLNAMGTDYYPRITGMIRDHKAASRLINEQTEIALLLSGPVFVAVISMAPWIVHLLYARSFAPSVEILRWQVLGDVLKVASWPLGFAILARGEGKTFFWTEAIAWVTLAALIKVFTPIFGIQITGIAYLVMYVAYLPIMYFLVRRRIGFHWSRSVRMLLIIMSTASVSVYALARFAPRIDGILGAILAMAFGGIAVVRISHKGRLGGPVGRFADMARRLVERVQQ